MSSARVRWALLLLTAWALAVRLYGIDFGVPWLKEPDTFIAEHARMIREGEIRFDRSLAACQYPSLLANAAAPLSHSVALPTGDETTLQEHQRSAGRVWVDVRTLVALLSILVVPATFWIARRFVEPPWALFAAALLAFSLLNVCFAQQARAHGPVLAFSACAVASALWLRREPSWRAYCAASAFAFLAIGTLHSGLAVLAPIAMAQLVRRDGKRFDPRLLLVFVAAAASIRIFYWYYFDEAALEALAGEDASQTFLRDPPFDGSGFARIARTLWFYEPVLLALVLVAAVVWFTTRRARAATGERVERGDLWVLGSYFVPYLLLAGLYNQNYERLSLPLLPFLAVFAAWGASQLVRRASSRARRPAVAACAVALALPAFASAKLAWLRARPDTLELTADWVREHVGLDAPLYVMPPLDFPWMRTSESLHWPPGKVAYFSPWARYQSKLDEAHRIPPLVAMYWLYAKNEPQFGTLANDQERLAYLRSFGPAVFIAEATDASGNVPRHRMWEGLRTHAQRLVRISPDPDPDSTNSALWAQDAESPDWPHVFWRVLRAHAVGPVVDVFRFEG